MRTMKNGLKVQCFLTQGIIKVQVKYAFEGHVFTQDVSVYVPRVMTGYTFERYAVQRRIERIVARKEARKFAVPNDNRWQFWSATIIDG